MLGVKGKIRVKSRGGLEKVREGNALTSVHYFFFLPFLMSVCKWGNAGTCLRYPIVLFGHINNPEHVFAKLTDYIFRRKETHVLIMV